MSTISAISTLMGDKTKTLLLGGAAVIGIVALVYASKKSDSAEPASEKTLNGTEKKNTAANKKATKKTGTLHV